MWNEHIENEPVQPTQDGWMEDEDKPLMDKVVNWFTSKMNKPDDDTNAVDFQQHGYKPPTVEKITTDAEDVLGGDETKAVDFGQGKYQTDYEEPDTLADYEEVVNDLKNTEELGFTDSVKASYYSDKLDITPTADERADEIAEEIRVQMMKDNSTGKINLPTKKILGPFHGIDWEKSFEQYPEYMDKPEIKEKLKVLSEELQTQTARSNSTAGSMIGSAGAYMTDDEVVDVMKFSLATGGGATLGKAIGVGTTSLLGKIGLGAAENIIGDLVVSGGVVDHAQEHGRNFNHKDNLKQIVVGGLVGSAIIETPTHMIAKLNTPAKDVGKVIQDTEASKVKADQDTEVDHTPMTEEQALLGDLMVMMKDDVKLKDVAKELSSPEPDFNKLYKTDEELDDAINEYRSTNNTPDTPTQVIERNVELEDKISKSDKYDDVLLKNDEDLLEMYNKSEPDEDLIKQMKELEAEADKIKELEACVYGKG